MKKLTMFMGIITGLLLFIGGFVCDNWKVCVVGIAVLILTFSPPIWNLGGKK